MSKEKIFSEHLQLEVLNEMNRGSMVEHLGIEFLEIGDDYLKASMPVDSRTMQPLGLLHGGASVALAETMGSIGANCIIDLQKKAAVGLEINANHIKSVREGRVIGISKPYHIGKGTHIWSIEIFNEKNQLVCISRLTMAIIDRK
ncbi:MAG: hotdog fold thioesterase [Bacteroidota bacterium]